MLPTNLNGQPWGRLLATGLALLVGLAGCSKHLALARPAAPLTLPTHLCGVGESPPSCRAPREIEALISAGPKLLGMADTPSGSQGAKILTLATTVRGARVVYRVKWRAQSTAGLINEPRKELAAYAVQKLFLSDRELVAPPTVVICLPLAEYRRFEPQEPPTFPNIDCVLGFASYWLEGVEDVEEAQKSGTLHESSGIWDRQRFQTDPVYRASVVNANVFTYVIHHGDAHDKQFMLERTQQGLRAEPIPSDGHAMSWQGSRLRIGLSDGEIELVTTRIRALLQRPEAAGAL